MARIHFMISPHPVPVGDDLLAFCGETVPKASVVQLGPDGALAEEFPSTIIFCRQCFGNRYLYMICAGQESLTENGLEAA